MANAKRSKGTGGGNTSAVESTSERSAIAEAIRQAVKALAPEKAYVINGDARLLEFANGVVVDLENRNPAIVILVLNREQAAQLPEGTHGRDGAIKMKKIHLTPKMFEYPFKTCYLVGEKYVGNGVWAIPPSQR